MQVCPDLGHAVPLSRLLPEAEILGADDVWISGCTCDSRQVRQGELFAALRGQPPRRPRLHRRSGRPRMRGRAD